MISNMAKALKLGLMDVLMKENTLKEKRMAKPILTNP